MDVLEQALTVVREVQASYTAIDMMDEAQQLRDMAALLMAKAEMLEQQARGTLDYEVLVKHCI